jgi:hypothetical protein
MGLRIRCPYQRVLPALSHPLCCTTFPLSYHSEDELGVLMGWKHILSGCVSIGRLHVSLPAYLCFSFAQYIYGVYLGLNGKLR